MNKVESCMDWNALLIAIAKDRDERAFRQFFHYFHDDLISFATSITNDKAGSQDLVAELMLNIWTGAFKLTHVQSVKTYLFKAIKNHALNYLARSKTHDKYVNSPHPTHNTNTPEDLLITKEALAHINSLINSLPPKTKMAFSLVKDNQCSYAEAAEIMEISPNTVDRHIQIALAKIKAGLQK